ncbi:hypothetical protein P355_0167 [Burkholderia cenocepacia KC-01]|nr:hypothetical protein P355_0167 [Burkholderia cenocepacia KC-01]
MREIPSRHLARYDGLGRQHIEINARPKHDHTNITWKRRRKLPLEDGAQLVRRLRTATNNNNVAVFQLQCAVVPNGLTLHDA